MQTLQRSFRLRQTPAGSQVQAPASLQHGLRFVLCLCVAWVCLGWNWSKDSVWALVAPESHQQYRLGQSLDELALPAEAASQDMSTLDEGLLLRQRGGRIVSLTVLKGPWKLLCDEQEVGESGSRLAQWEEILGAPRARYVHPDKHGTMHYYRAALADIALLVDFGQVRSVVLMEPGSLEPALERTGYQQLPQ